MGGRKQKEKADTKDTIKWVIRVGVMLLVVAILAMSIYTVFKVRDLKDNSNGGGGGGGGNRHHDNDDSDSGWWNNEERNLHSNAIQITSSTPTTPPVPAAEKIQTELDPDFDLRKTATFCTDGKTLSSFGCSTLNGHCLVKFDRILNAGNVAALNQSVLQVSTTNYYNFFAVISNNMGCPFRTMDVSVVEITSNTVLAEANVNAFDKSILNFSMIIQANSQIAIFIRHFGSILPYTITISGGISKVGNYDNNVFVTGQDQALKIRYIPNRPTGLPNPPYPDQYPTSTTVFPWFNKTIPYDYVTEASLPSGLPNRDRYDKFRSVQYSVGFYLGLDMNTIDPKDPRLSIFLTNYEDRGNDNYRKKVYMTALTSGMMVHYKEKIAAFINEAYSNSVTYGQPVLSSFKVALVKFFLAIHVGYDDYPDYVIDYFTKFVDVIGFGDPTRPGRNDAIMFGSENIGKVRAYFSQRNVIVKNNLDETSIIYHWHLAGLHPDGLVMEAVHNIIAFSQYNNVLYLLINDKVHGTAVPFPPGAISYDFFEKYANTTIDAERLNIVREVYRLLVPNSVSFSRVREANPADPTVTIQGRHVHKAIMVIATNISTGGLNPAAYFAYNPSLYAPYDTDFSETSCPFQGLGDQPNAYIPDDLFETSPVDGETLLDKCNDKMFPVYPLPLYAPFGLGYRRCAGEVLNYFLTMQLMEKFMNTQFEFRTVTPQTGVVTLAPFTSVPDNIYVL